jgi:hypothetical protein
MNILNWLITSSADPKKWSLFVKGVLLLWGAQIVSLFDAVCSFGLACLGVDTTFVNQLAEGVEAVIYGGLIVIGLIWSLYGGIRKVYLTGWSGKE